MVNIVSSLAGAHKALLMLIIVDLCCVVPPPRLLINEDEAVITFKQVLQTSYVLLWAPYSNKSQYVCNIVMGLQYVII